MKKLILAGLLLPALNLSTAQASPVQDPAPAARPQDRKPQDKPAERPKERPPQDKPTDRPDAGGIPADRRAELLKNYDANKNGKLDPEEIEKARKDGKLPAERPQGGPGDKPGEGGVPADRRAELLKNYDANKNGKLDPEEIEKARKDGKLPAERPADGGGERGKQMREQLLREYDANKNGRLDPEELEKARKDGKLPADRGGNGGRGRGNGEGRGKGGDGNGGDGKGGGERGKGTPERRPTGGDGGNGPVKRRPVGGGDGGLR